MRVGIFTDTYFPQINGVVTSILMLRQNLQAQSHQVYIFTTTDPNAPNNEENVYRLPSLPVLNDKRMGVFYHPGLIKLIRCLNLDVIHTHTEFCLGVLGRYMARELRLPRIHTMHTVYEDYTHYLTKQRMLCSMAKVITKKISADFCNTADSVIAPTDKVKELMLSYGVRSEINTIPTGIALDRFAPEKYSRDAVQRVRREFGIARNEKVMLYLGRLAEEKNIPELFTFSQQYLKSTGGAKLLLVGDGADRFSLEELAKKLGISDKTIFAGARPWKEIGIYYQAGDVFVSTSQSEAQGLTYIEAMAAGLPVAAKSDRCLEKVLSDGNNGHSFEDKAGFEIALKKILSNDSEYQKLSAGALKTASRFSAAEYAERVVDIYIREKRRVKRINKFMKFNKEIEQSVVPCYKAIEMVL